MATWPPTKDMAFNTYCTNFGGKLSAAPTTYGLVAADATAFAALVTSYTNALNTATNPTTRTKTAVTNKNVAKAQLLASLRILAKRIQANPAVTAGMKTDLGLPIHQTIPSPIPAPDAAPLVSIVTYGNRAVTLRIGDSVDTNRRAKPAGVDGAEVYCYVGTTPPASLADWRFAGQAKRQDFTIEFTAADVGKTVYFAARWFNPRGEPGPLSATINGTLAGSAAGEAEPALKLTAPNDPPQSLAA